MAGGELNAVFGDRAEIADILTVHQALGGVLMDTDGITIDIDCRDSNKDNVDNNAVT